MSKTLERIVFGSNLVVGVALGVISAYVFAYGDTDTQFIHCLAIGFSGALIGGISGYCSGSRGLLSSATLLNSAVAGGATMLWLEKVIKPSDKLMIAMPGMLVMILYLSTSATSGFIFRIVRATKQSAGKQQSREE